MSAKPNHAVQRVEPEAVPADKLLETATALKLDGWRFATATCLDRGETLEVLYHLDRDLELRNLSVSVPKPGKVPSLTPVYLCAFLAENEMHELFGLEVEGMAIDFGGGLLLAAGSPKAPMLKSAPGGK